MSLNGLGLLDYLFNPIYYGWGIFLAETIKSIYLIILVAIVIFILLLLLIFLLRNFKKKRKLTVTVILIIFYYFIVFIPFLSGTEIIDMKYFGMIQKTKDFMINKQEKMHQNQFKNY